MKLYLKINTKYDGLIPGFYFHINKNDDFDTILKTGLIIFFKEFESGKVRLPTKGINQTRTIKFSQRMKLKYYA